MFDYLFSYFILGKFVYLFSLIYTCTCNLHIIMCFKYTVLIVERVYVHVMMVQGDPVPCVRLQQVQLIDTPLHNHRVTYVIAYKHQLSHIFESMCIVGSRYTFVIIHLMSYFYHNCCVCIFFIIIFFL